MSPRRLLAWVAVFTSGGLAILGFIVFVVGVLIEFVANSQQPISETISPTIQLSLAGLCLSAVMVFLGFGLIGLLLSRQSRQLGAGYGDAYRLMENFQFTKAIPLLERMIAEGKSTADVLMLLTSAYAHTGQLEKAQSMADRSVHLFPGDPGAYITLANGYRLQASYQEAASALQVATQLAPDQPIVWAELGFMQHLAGEKATAAESFKRATLHAIPVMYAVRVYYHLGQHYQQAALTEKYQEMLIKMVDAQNGLSAWEGALSALEGTVYGQSLKHEIAMIQEAITQASMLTNR